MIRINGAFGEGGGQILRSSLGLSIYTGKAFTIENIRANRKKPGLLRQHLTAVNAAARISGAEVSGAAMGSQTVRFVPGQLKPGSYRFSIGTAGSTTLVFQTLLPAFLTGDGQYDIRFEGGTHNMMAPPYDFLRDSFFGVLGQMGAKIESELLRHGFYPAGGGAFRVKVDSVPMLKPFELIRRGEILERDARCIVAQLPYRIAREEADIAARLLQWNPENCKAETVQSNGPGNVVMVKIKSERITQLFTGFGKRNVPLKQVVKDAVRQTRQYLDSDVVVGGYLADQLLIPMAIAGGGSFVTGKPSLHMETNIETVKQFMDVEFDLQQLEEQQYKVTLKA